MSENSADNCGTYPCPNEDTRTGIIMGCPCSSWSPRPRPEVDKPDKFESANLIVGASRMRGEKL